MQVLAAPAIDSQGNVYVVSTNGLSGSIDKFTSSPSPLISQPLPWAGRGSVALSPDEKTLYLTSDTTLTALSTTTFDLRWMDSASGGNESTPLVDADGTVYWVSRHEIRAYDPAGALLWVHKSHIEFDNMSSPVLGALGNLYVGGAFGGQASLAVFRNLRPWPSSDVRLDLAASNGISYSDGHFQTTSGMEMVTNMAPLLHKRVEPDPSPLYNYRLVEFDRRWGKTADTYISIDADREAYLNSFNPDFFGYGVIVDHPEHYTRFLHHWNSENPHQPLGSYLSSVTCVDSPQDLSNLSMAGNNYPATVADCCAITGASVDCEVPLHTPPFYNVADGRYFLRFDDPTVVAATMTHLRSVLREQHLTPHVFLDNGRYPAANSIEARTCHDCIAACPDEICVETCKNVTCVDSRDTAPVHVGSGYNVAMGDLVGYFSTLLDTLNDEGYKGILNTAVTPFLMGDYIEEDWLAAFEAAVGPGNGLAFELAWHASSKSNPRFVDQEIRLYQRFLSQGMLVLHYPKYADVGEQMWTAAMDLSVREPGQSLFLSRAGGVAAPFWVDWSDFYGAPWGPISFNTPCATCMTAYRTTGDWYTTRDFVNGRKITTVGLYQDVVLDAFKREGDKLSYGDESSLNRESLEALLSGYDLTQYTVVHEPELGEAFDVVLGEYQLDNDKLIDAFKETYETVHFVTSFANYRFGDYFGLGKGCNPEGTHCDELIMVSMQIMLRINKAPAP